MIDGEDIETLKRRYPVITGKDIKGGITIGELARRIGAALDANATPESAEDIACDVIDRDFLFGAWGYRWTPNDAELLRDLRGIIVAVYRAGKAKR